MTKENQKKKLRKTALRLLSIVLALISVLIIAGIVLQHQIPALLKAKINEQSHGIYQLNYQTFELSLIGGKAKLVNVHLLPDTASYQKINVAEKSTDLWDIRCQSIELSGIKWLTFLLQKRVAIRKLRVNKPSIHRLVMREQAEHQGKQQKAERMPKMLTKARFGCIQLNQIAYQVTHAYDSTKSSGWLRNLNLEVNDLYLDKEMLQATDRVFYAKDIQVYGRNISYATRDGLYRLKVAKLTASTQQQKITIDSFAVVPQYPELEFSKKLVYSGDRYDMLYPSIRVEHIGFKELERHGRLPVQLLAIDSAAVHIFVNKGMPTKTTIATNNFPAFAFRRLQLPLTVDSLRLNGVDVYYKELNPKSQRAGTVLFANLTGQFVNVSNDSLHWKKDPWIKGKLSTNFLGKPKLKVDLNIDMSSKVGAFNYQGTLSGAPATFYNQLLEPLMLAKAEKGYIQTIRFDVKANRYGAQVHTEMLYRDLKVAVLDAESGKLDKKGILSLFVNWIAVKTNNPDKPDEVPRIADFHYDHPQEKTFFNLMWKAIYNGLKTNLGVPEL